MRAWCTIAWWTVSKPEDIILEGIVGSTAFGLATENSDQDRQGIYRAPLEDVLGLRSSAVVSGSWTHTDPDIALHEVGKFFSLALKCNPTILELLWLNKYVRKTYAGSKIVAARKQFLHEKGVRNSYGGYAISQLGRLRRGTGKTDAKLGRHARRLLIQGKQLLTTGDMQIDVSEYRDEIFEFGNLAENHTSVFEERFYRCYDEFMQAESVLPEVPNTEFVNHLLVSTRLKKENAVYKSGL